MNSRRHTITSLSIVLLAVTIMSVSAIGQNAYAAAGMSLSADCSGSACAISGDTDRDDQPVMLRITSANGIHGVDQLSVSGGSYSTTVNVSNLDDGTYTIKVNQGSSGKYNLSLDVDVSGGSSSSSASVSNMVAAAEEDTGTVESASLGGLQLTAGGMEGSTTIDVSGTTDRSGDITLTVTAPNGNIITVSQISPSSGSFATTIEVGGPLWSQDGMYSINAVQGAASSHQKTAQVEIVDGHVIPEFGVIAAMILAVAIVSIIVVTAKTKLSLVPRY
jgi:predicted secreted protein with PEFG-CTERM motif